MFGFSQLGGLAGAEEGTADSATTPDGALLLSGDAQSGTDALQTSGDEQTGTDVIQTSVAS